MEQRICIFSDNNLWVSYNEPTQAEIPQIEQIPIELLQKYKQLDIAIIDEKKYTTIDIESNISLENIGLYKSPLRPLFNTMEQNMFVAACKASQMNYWNQHSKFCPACGTLTEQFAYNAKRCPNCKFEIYPTISPASITLISKGDEILLVRAKNFRGNHYGLVAGFLEVGESAEECAIREVREETGLEIDNIKYFGTQSWPFPSGLMIAFTANYKGGKIKIQEEELVDAAFFKINNLPELPNEMSVARKLINDFISKRI